MKHSYCYLFPFISRKFFGPVHMDFHHILNLMSVFLRWILIIACFWVRQFCFPTNSELFSFSVTTKTHKDLSKIPLPIKSLWIEHTLCSSIYPLIQTNSFHCKTQLQIILPSQNIIEYFTCSIYYIFSNNDTLF